MTLTESIVELVTNVGYSLRAWRSRGGTEGHWDGTQFHARADRWAHEILTEGLAGLDPGIPLISEEHSTNAAYVAAQRYWLIDPIDGTASYAEGFAGYVTQVALMETDRPVMAVVFAPESQELFVAERGHGAFLNGRRLPSVASPALTLIDNTPSPRGLAADLYRDLSFSRYVESGSIGLKICRVAEGAVDAFVKDVTVRDWDLAGPHLILEEVGGCLLDRLGAEIAYSGRGIHDGLLVGRVHDLVRRIVCWSRERAAASGSSARSNSGQVPPSSGPS